jgi:hypothetical protein
MSQGPTQSRIALQPRLARVNAAARSAAQTRFTAPLHHIDQDALGRAFDRQRRRAAAGVDGITVQAYEQNLAANLLELHRRIHTGRYRPRPRPCHERCLQAAHVALTKSWETLLMSLRMNDAKRVVKPEAAQPYPALTSFSHLLFLSTSSSRRLWSKNRRSRSHPRLACQSD